MSNSDIVRDVSVVYKSCTLIYLIDQTKQWFQIYIL